MAREDLDKIGRRILCAIGRARTTAIGVTEEENVLVRQVLKYCKAADSQHCEIGRIAWHEFEVSASNE